MSKEGTVAGWTNAHRCKTSNNADCPFKSDCVDACNNLGNDCQAFSFYGQVNARGQCQLFFPPGVTTLPSSYSDSPPPGPADPREVFFNDYAAFRNDLFDPVEPGKTGCSGSHTGDECSLYTTPSDALSYGDTISASPIDAVLGTWNPSYRGQCQIKGNPCGAAGTCEDY